MLRHKDIWRGVDRLAAKHGLSASGLARRAGLDPTAFNKSKRTTREGRPRWPSTESVSKILDCTGESFASFVGLVAERGRGAGRQRVPVIGYAQAGAEGYFDDAGYPTGRGWDMIDLPTIGDGGDYALQITGDSMEPVYRQGDVIVVSPGAGLEPGDRVVLKTRSGEVMAKELVRRNARRIELRSVNVSHPDRTFTPREVLWIARIMWVSQ